MKRKVLITGASKGIGLALCRLFLKEGYEVLGSSRSGGIRHIIHPCFTAFKLDLSSPEDIDESISYLIDNHEIDILINNAGIGLDLNEPLPEKESFIRTFDVNVTGTVLFTEAVLEMLNNKGKIINISSHMGSISGCRSSDSVAYRMSKSALNMYTKILSERLEGRHFVASVHPGWVRTTITENNIHRARLLPEESAFNIYNFINEEHETGIYWNTELQRRIDW